MAKVFVSHASADKAFVDDFVDNVLRIGLGLNGEKVFYTSERDTGVPTGHDLISTVRREVSQATLVIAVITPTYQTRPVCIAELGAAWGRTEPDRFFPLLAPGPDRADLEGVIPHTLVERIDDPAALDELSDRIEGLLGALASKTQWGIGKQKWLAKCHASAKAIAVPDVPTPARFEAMNTELTEIKSALEFTTNEVTEWQKKFAALEKTKDAQEARQIRVGEKVQERLKDALSTASAALDRLPRPAREAIYQGLRGNAAPYPNRFDDPGLADEFDDAIERDLIVEDDDGLYVPNEEKRPVGEAVGAVSRLRSTLDRIREDPDHSDWFYDQYDVDPKLSDRDCWDALLG